MDTEMRVKEGDGSAEALCLDKVTLLVLSTDGFQDCWDPFFSLLRIYWPDCRLRVLLTTETVDYTFEGVNLQATQAQERLGYRPTWTQSLELGLALVETPLVLICLDDFFLNGPVDISLLGRVIRLMLEYGYSTVALTEHGSRRPATVCEHPELLEVDRKARYRLTTSPALWDVTALRRYTHGPENAWQFEIFGSWRARRRDDRFFIVNPAVLGNGREGVFPYFQGEQDSGIVKGAWQKEIPELFASHDINIDYSRRGFLEASGRATAKIRTVRKLLQNPRQCLFGGSLI